jgi:hypothetical protein
LINHIDELQFTQGSFEHGVQQLIQNVAYNGKCSGLGHSEHTHNLVRGGWKLSYRYFNTHTNVNGTHVAIQQLINELPSSNATPSSISRRPAVSSSSSASASAAPRTPRAGRAASAAVREEVGQINKQNPGCMLLLLLVMLFTMRGAAFIYYGKGGRDPIIMNYPLLNQPIISSKHTTYESMSFPTHSIQMKNYSKTRSNNSKTRSNTRTTRSSKRNNTRHSHKIPYAKIEDFDKLSLVSFYHYLRFEAFPGVSPKEKKEMFKIAAIVPLQRPDVFAQIVEAAKEKDMDDMMDILEENKLDLSKLGLEIEPYQELWNSILDAYFAEKDYPFDLLQTLLHVGDQVEDFLKRYHSANKEMKKMMVMQTCITASDCPELMLE